MTLVNSILLAIPVVAIVVMGYRQRWVSEDAFISLRVVDQILAGNGPVYNAGERVEAHTNPLWVALLTVPGIAGIDLPLTTVFLGIVFSGLGLLAGITGAMQIERRLAAANGSDRIPLLVPLGALAFVAVPVGWDFVTSGLESGLGFGWLGISFWLLARAAVSAPTTPAWQWCLSAFVMGLGPLIRPDFAIFSVGFLLALVFGWLHASRSRHFWKKLLATIAVAGALPVGYQIFRMGYYAALVPNTALTKEAGSSNWEQGWIYLSDFIDPYWLWIPLVIVLGLWLPRVVSATRHGDWSAVVLLAVPVLTALLHAAYVVRVGGDFMHGRLLLPALFTSMLPLAAIRVPLALSPRVVLTSLAILAVLVWSVIAATTLRSPHGPEVDEESGIVDERAFYVEAAEHPNPVTLDDYAENEFGLLVRGRNAREWTETREPAVVIEDNIYPIANHVHDDIRLVLPVGNIGILGYAAGPSVHLVDRLGLADPIGSRIEVEERGRPGHEKALPMVWVSARFTGIETESVSNEAFRSARAALACGDLAELIEATTEPLTVNRFLTNIRLSWSLHTLRIPPEPQEAEERFCTR